MTKEEVLNTIPPQDAQKHDITPMYTTRETHLAMDEYAKQQAIEFAEWGFKDDNPFVEGSNGRWIQQCGNSSSWSTEDLYNKFIESQNKKA